MPEFLVVQWRSAMLDAAARAFILFLAAGVAAFVLRRAPAAARHLVWQLALGGCLALPFLSLLLPAWQISVPQGALPAAPLRAIRMPTRRAEMRPVVLDRHGASVAGRSHAERHSSRPAVASSTAVVSARRSPQAGVAAPLPPFLSLFLLWLAGVVLLLIRALASLLQLHRIRRRCRRITAAPVLALAGQLAREAGLRRPVTLLHGLLDGPPALPMTWGFRHPVVLLPTGFAAWPEARQRTVLLHELAHIQRGDWLAQRLAGLTCALYWFHPLVWWAARRLRMESEQACDDQVLAAGVKASDYASHLLEIVRTAQRSRRLLRAAVSMARGPHLEGRLRAVLDGRSHHGTPSRRASTLVWAAAVGLLLPLAAARVTARTPRTPLRPAPAAALAAPSLRLIGAVPRIEICRIREMQVVKVRRPIRTVSTPRAPVPSRPSTPPAAARPEIAAFSPPLSPVPAAARPAALATPAAAARPASPAAAARPAARPTPPAPAVPPVQVELSADRTVIDPAPEVRPRTFIALGPMVRSAVTAAFNVDFTRRHSIVVWAAERERSDRREGRSEEPNLADQDLSGANLAGRDLSGRDLSGKDLSGANLAGAKLTNTNLSHSDLSGANLANADLSHAKLAGTDLSGANLNAARLVGLDLSGCDLSGSNLSQVETRDLTAAHADLSGSNLKGIRLDGRDLSGSDFSGADLSGARLAGANLTKADLSGANLANADLSHARLTNADLSGANLNGTKLDGADLAGADVSGTKLDRSSSE